MWSYQTIINFLKENWFIFAFGIFIIFVLTKDRLFRWWRRRKFEENKDKVFPELKNEEYSLINSTQKMFNSLDKVLNDMENPNKNIMLLTTMMEECQKKVNEVNKMIDSMCNIRNDILIRYKVLGERLNRIKSCNGNINNNNNNQPQQQQQNQQQAWQQQQSQQQQNVIPEDFNLDYNDGFLQKEENKSFFN